MINKFGDLVITDHNGSLSYPTVFTTLTQYLVGKKMRYKYTLGIVEIPGEDHLIHEILEQLTLCKNEEMFTITPVTYEGKRCKDKLRDVFVSFKGIVSKNKYISCRSNKKNKRLSRLTTTNEVQMFNKVEELTEPFFCSMIYRWDNVEEEEFSVDG